MGLSKQTKPRRPQHKPSKGLQTCKLDGNADRQSVRILASARARASAQAAGTATSSGLSGAVGAGRSQLGAEFGFGTQMSGLSSEIATFQGQAQRASNIAQLGMKAVGFGLSQGGQTAVIDSTAYVKKEYFS